MDILNLHFSKFDFDKPEQTKIVIREFFLANSSFRDVALSDLVDLVFLTWQQGYEDGRAAQADIDAGLDDY